MRQADGGGGIWGLPAGLLVAPGPAVLCLKHLRDLSWAWIDFLSTDWPQNEHGIWVGRRGRLAGAGAAVAGGAGPGGALDRDPGTGGAGAGDPGSGAGGTGAGGAAIFGLYHY